MQENQVSWEGIPHQVPLDLVPNAPLDKLLEEKLVFHNSRLELRGFEFYFEEKTITEAQERSSDASPHEISRLNSDKIGELRFQ